MEILVTGGTGFIGLALCERLVARGDVVRVPSRSPSKAAARLPGRARVLALPETPGQWREAVAGCDAVVNLAGESVAGGRWTESRKAAIRSSRVAITGALVEAIRDVDPRPRVLVSASAIGFYGPRGDEEIGEERGPGTDFLAGVCVDWEAAAQAAAPLGVRVVLPRIGVVLGEGGGALERMLPPFRAFVGGPIGDGQQWISWIHRDDVVGLILWSLDRPEVSGPLNATAPAPVTMNDFSRALGAVLGRPALFRVPGFVLRLALGEFADVLLTGQRVVPGVAARGGYRFAHAQLEGALRASIGG